MPIRRHWFLIGLVLVVALALSLGRNLDQAGWGSLLRNSAVFLIFLGTGYSLDTRRILQDVSAIHHHLALQIFIFLAVPLLILGPAFLIGGTLADPAVWVGLAAVAVLPTTISSCIAFTQVAGGNVPLSMLNSALSNALGILLSPLLLSLFIGFAPDAVEAGGVTTPAATGGALLLGWEATLSIFGSLARLMVAPAVIGQAVRILLLRRRWTGEARRESSREEASTMRPAYDAPGASRVRPLNSALILLIVFLTLASATTDRGIVSTATRFLPVIGYLALLHIVILLAAGGLGTLLSEDRRDRVAVLFTGSQKTLAFGAPMLTLYFAGAPEQLASAMLPLIFYHLWQLVVAGVVESFFTVQRAKE
ncbi:MAG: bile acid:sodium symporter [Spirochaetaceae bacterium]